MVIWRLIAYGGLRRRESIYIRRKL